MGKQRAAGPTSAAALRPGRPTPGERRGPGEQRNPGPARPGAPVTRDSLLASQRLAGNRATAAAIAVQRNGNGDGGQSTGGTAKKVAQQGTEVVTESTGALATATFSASTAPDFRGIELANGLGDLSAVSDATSAWLGLGLDIVVLGQAIKDSMDPRSEAEHEQALKRVEDVVKGSLAKSWNAGRQACNMIGTFAKEGSALKGAGEFGNSVAALPVAYLNFSTNLIKVGENYMTLANLEETQFSAWNSPDKALQAAEGEEKAVEQSAMNVSEALNSADDAAEKKQQTLKLVESLYHKVKKAKKDALKAAGRPSKEQEVEDAFWNELERRKKKYDKEKAGLARLEKAAGHLRELKKSTLGLWGTAADKTVARKNFKKAVDKEVAEQKTDRQHPADRYVSITEIHLYAMDSITRKAWQNKALTAAALIGFAGGVVGLALGWTPVGWALIAASGAIGLGIAGFKLGRFALEKLGVSRNKPKAYAKHLWQYATLGTTDKEPATDDAVKDARRRDALGLIRRLGLAWSPADVQKMAPKDAISQIAEKIGGN